MRVFAALLTFLFWQPCLGQSEQELLDAMGPEKAVVLKASMESFNRFLDANYSDKESERDKILAYLEDWKDWSVVDLVLPDGARELWLAWEASGLWQDIWLTESEEYVRDSTWEADGDLT